MKVFDRQYIQQILNWHDWMDTPMKNVRTCSHSKLGLSDNLGGYKRKRGQENTLYSDMMRDSEIFYFNGKPVPVFRDINEARLHVKHGVAIEAIALLERYFYQSTSAAVSKALENALNYLPEEFYVDCVDYIASQYTTVTEYTRKELSLDDKKWIFKVEGKIRITYTKDAMRQTKPIKELDFGGVSHFDFSVNTEGWGFILQEMSLSEDKACLDLLDAYLKSVKRQNYIQAVRAKLLQPMEHYIQTRESFISKHLVNTPVKKLRQLTAAKSGEEQLQLFRKFTMADIVALNTVELKQIVGNMWFFLYPLVFHYIINQLNPINIVNEMLPFELK